VLWCDISSVAQGGFSGKGSAAVSWLLGESRAPHGSCSLCGSTAHWIMQVWHLTNGAGVCAVLALCGAVFVEWGPSGV
jgi:hypothetical protein